MNLVKYVVKLMNLVSCATNVTVRIIKNASQICKRKTPFRGSVQNAKEIF